jgi:hypothetical protein
LTHIEILTPDQKQGKGFDWYLHQRSSLLKNSINVIEIDLLRDGFRLPLPESLPPAPYFVFLTRFDQPTVTEVWSISVEKCLPEIPIPLLPRDGDLTLDLQKAWRAFYRNCGAVQLVDYSKPPEIALSPEQDAWVDERLRAAGLRP